jgi:hypothetical protein
MLSCSATHWPYAPAPKFRRHPPDRTAAPPMHRTAPTAGKLEP